MAHRQPRNPVTAGSESELRRNPRRDPQGSSSTLLPLIPSTVRLLSEENKKRIQEWETERTEERKSTELYRARCTADKTEMYQLLGFYSVFQGVVFNTVATSTKLTCQTSWLPAVLSLLIFVSTATSVHYKLTDYESDTLRLVNSQNIEQEVMNKITFLKTNGDDFDFMAYIIPDTEKKAPPQLGNYYRAIMSFLALFSVIILACCFILRCWDPEKVCTCPCTCCVPS